MGGKLIKNTKIKTILVSIDKNVNKGENINYQKILLNNKNVDLKCFETVDKGIQFLNKIEFERTIIITSGSIYSEFYNKFKDNINNLTIIPKIIIFTSPSNKNKLVNLNNNDLPINDPFYNVGGVVDTFFPVQQFLVPKKLYNEDDIEIIEFDREKDDKFNFECITEKGQLIIPLFFAEYYNNPTEDEIKYFNKKKKKNFKERSINNLFSQLLEVSNIPKPILSKYFVRAYTAESNFYRKMNEDLLQNIVRNYLTFIQILYESIKKKYLKPEFNKKLYRGAMISKKEYNLIIEYMKSKKNDLPAAIVYGRAFFSFSDSEKVANDFKERKRKYMKKDDMIGLFFIEECPKNNLCIGNASIKEYSFYKSESEILFFPFSCFEIKDAKIINDNEFFITLKYLGQYQKLFEGEDPKELLKRVPETSKIAKHIFSAKIFKPILEFPIWSIKNYDCKIMLLGNNLVGKTSIINRFCENKFSDKNITAKGVDFKNKEVIRGNIKIRLQIWDISGQEKSSSIMKSYYKCTHGILLVYDITDKNSFDSIIEWINEIKKDVDLNKTGLVVVGNKCDVPEDRVVSDLMREDLEKNLNIRFFEISAKNNINIEESFNFLLEEIIEIVETEKKTRTIDKIIRNKGI